MGFNFSKCNVMIAQIIDLLKKAPYYGCSDTIEIAKGKHAIPKNWKEAKEQIKRYRLFLFKK